MWYRLQIGLVLLAPVLFVAAAWVLGRQIPLPVLGRDYVIRVELPEAGTPIDLPDVAGPEDPSRPLVVIDAGHGGHDPGASGNGIREKTIVLGLARELRDELLEQGGIRVALTREDDRFLIHEERFGIARALGADLFISLHADSAGEKSGVAGASIYTLSTEASSEAAERFARSENSSDAINGVMLSGQTDEVSTILVELSQRRTSDSSVQFAELIEREGEGEIAFHPQTLRSAALRVLRAPDVPSVLFEAGFVTNPEQAQELASPEGRERIAAAIAQAIRVYFARNSGLPA